jgi:hypothetical protein
MRAARAPVKYSVVNQENDCGLLIAMPVKRTVQRGNKLVAKLAVFSYASKIFCPLVFFGSCNENIL